jgi:hypothetical protein
VTSEEIGYFEEVIFYYFIHLYIRKRKTPVMELVIILIIIGAENGSPLPRANAFDTGDAPHKNKTLYYPNY